MKTMKYLAVMQCAVLIVFGFTGKAFSGVDVAVYNDSSYPNGGAWVEGITAINAMLDAYGYSHEDITPDTVNSTTDLHSLYKVIIFGGGWAAGYNTYITKSGYDNLRKFVADGGGYFGICAGSYFPSDLVAWKPDYSTPREIYNYPFDLFKGMGIGAVLGIKTWTSPTGCSTGITEGAAMTTVTINNTVLPDVSPQLPILYYGGPLFVPAQELKDQVTVVATYEVPGKPSDASPAMILFPYGEGMVFLTGPHPEVSFNTETCTLYYDNETWKLMDSVLKLLTEP